MIEYTWRLLLRLNARAIFVVSGLILVLVLALIERQLRHPSQEGPVYAPEYMGLEIQPDVDETVREPAPAPEDRMNPFFSEYLRDLVAREESERLKKLLEAKKREAALAAEKAREAASARARSRKPGIALVEKPAPKPAVKAVTKPAPVKPAPVLKKAAPQQKSKSVKLIYRGMITRTDGVTVAMIENRTAKNTFSYATGDIVEGLRVDRILRNEVSLVLKDNSSHVLPVGQEKTVMGQE